MATGTRILRFTGFPFSRRRPAGLVGGILERLLTWQGRAAQRHHLARVEARLLEDMGFSRADARREAAKPFWRG